MGRTALLSGKRRVIRLEIGRCSAAPRSYWTRYASLRGTMRESVIKLLLLRPSRVVPRYTSNRPNADLHLLRGRKSGGGARDAALRPSDSRWTCYGRKSPRSVHECVRETASDVRRRATH